MYSNTFSSFSSFLTSRKKQFVHVHESTDVPGLRLLPTEHPELVLPERLLQQWIEWHVPGRRIWRYEEKIIATNSCDVSLKVFREVSYEVACNVPYEVSCEVFLERVLFLFSLSVLPLSKRLVAVWTNLLSFYPSWPVSIPGPLAVLAKSRPNHVHSHPFESDPL